MLDDTAPPPKPPEPSPEDDLRGMILLSRAIVRGERVSCHYISDHNLILALAHTVVHLAERTEK